MRSICCLAPLISELSNQFYEDLRKIAELRPLVRDIDVNKVLEANAVFKEAMEDYFFPPEALAISPEVVFSPMPGGALTARFVLEEVHHLARGPDHVGVLIQNDDGGMKGGDNCKALRALRVHNLDVHCMGILLQPAGETSGEKGCPDKMTM